MDKKEKLRSAIELINKVVENYYLDTKVDQVGISFLELASEIIIHEEFSDDLCQ